MKICSFNLRVRVEADGINILDNRMPRILETIKAEMPDIIGFQEAATAAREELATTLFPLGYTLLGCGRNGEYRGEGVPLAFRRDRFQLISFDSVWLSNTPHIPGSRYGGDQSGCPRMLTAAVLKPLGAPPFLFINTHLDHKGANAKLLGAADILQYAAAKGLPVVITGDTNATPTDPSMVLLTEAAPNGKPLVDATAGLDGTFHDFGRRELERRRKIDYIFTDLPCDPAKSYKIKDEGVDGIYISDHFPVIAFAELEGEQA